jgi:predicted ArsR family transcriptional regulator
VTSEWETVAALSDPVRRALFCHVRRQDHPVTREEAADAVAVSRSLTAFHLDKLVDAGLLRARYEAPPDRRRGRGRTPKVYEATGESLNLTVPPRQYELVGEILADAVAAAPTDARAYAERHATELGCQLAASYATQSSGRPRSVRSVDGELSAVHSVLTELGFEPRPGDGAELVLDNCPFHSLAERQPELICGLNHAFLTGLLTGLGTDRLRADLRPRPGACCVCVHP